MGNTDDVTMPGKEELLKVLSEAVNEVFNSLVFSFTAATIRTDDDTGGEKIEVLDGPSPGEKEHVQASARVCFTGAIDGSVVLRCYAEGAMDIARGLLMMDESEALEVEEIADALGECANMVTGVLKTKALDPVGDFHMTVPEVTTSAPDGVGDTCGVLAYRLSKGLVSMEIWVDEKDAREAA